MTQFKYSKWDAVRRHGGQHQPVGAHAAWQGGPGRLVQVPAVFRQQG